MSQTLECAFKIKDAQIWLAKNMPGASLLRTNTLNLFVSLMSAYT